MGDIMFNRMFRTLSSERFMIEIGGEHVGSLDLHFLDDGHIEATLVLLDRELTPEAKIPDLLDEIHLRLFGRDDQGNRRTCFNVIYGEAHGEFSPGVKV